MRREIPVMAPFFRWTVLCNGVPIAKCENYLLIGGHQAYSPVVLGNGRYKSAATYFSLGFAETQWIREDELLWTRIRLEIDARPVGEATGIVIPCDTQWPQGPVALLNWTKLNRIWGSNSEPTDEYERFSLLIEKPYSGIV